MSATIIRPAKEKLEALLKEIQEMDLTPSEQMLTREETRQQHEARKRIIEERIMSQTAYCCSPFTKNIRHPKIKLFNCMSKGRCLTGRGYDITPENYDVIRKVLIEKFGQSHIIKKSFYNELYSVKRRMIEMEDNS
uniref:Uncharacterized protein n=1 Tax=Brugia malayi TaxID=6279 RepID=A8NIZ7_BRUMA